MTTFFTADLHLGHARIIELCNRPFRNLDEMHNAIISNWNGVVDTDDSVMILGDLAMGSIRETMKLVPKLNGTKFLVPGNHDRVWHGYPMREHRRQEFLDLYNSVGLIILPDYVPYGNWLLSHFPAVEPVEDQRYTEYLPVLPHNKILVHGHVHNEWQINGRQINVGVDVWDFTPISEDRISEVTGVGPRVLHL